MLLEVESYRRHRCTRRRLARTYIGLSMPKCTLKAKLKCTTDADSEMPPPNFPKPPSGLGAAAVRPLFGHNIVHHRTTPAPKALCLAPTCDCETREYRPRGTLMALRCAWPIGRKSTVPPLNFGLSPGLPRACARRLLF